MKKKIKCYIYTRVSTAIQVDGYTSRMKRWAVMAPQNVS